MIVKELPSRLKIGNSIKKEKKTEAQPEMQLCHVYFTFLLIVIIRNTKKNGFMYSYDFH